MTPPAPAGDFGGYTPPVEDYAFLLGEAFGEDIVARSSGGEFTAEDIIDVLDGAGEFASEVFAPLNRSGDVAGISLVDGQAHTPEGFIDAYRAFADAGWVTAMQTASSGGDGLPNSVQQALTEFWNASNASLSLAPLLTTGQIHALDAYASEELRETYMTRLVSGEWAGTMNLTEPQAGSDLGAITSIARQNPDGTWAVSGQKIFITWGDHDLTDNIVHLVLARTEGAPEGHAGLSLFVVPKYLVNADGSIGARNAIETVSVEHKLGIHGSPTCVLQFDGATGYLVGEQHAGLRGMFVMMNQARISVGVQGVALSDRAYQAAHAYAVSRVQGPVIGRPDGTPIAEHPDVRRLLLSMASRISAMRAFAVMVGDLQDRAEAEGGRSETQTLLEFFVPIFKSWCTEQAVLITSDAVQVHGGVGFIEETGVAQQYRDVRILTIYEGTTAIQANDLIGRKLLRDSGATAQRVFAQVEEQIAALRATGDAGAARGAERLERALASGRKATETLLGFASTPRDAHAVGVPYAMLLGLLTGGWMHAVIANAVLRHDSPSDEDRRRLVEADFYGAHHLPQVHALLETIGAGEI
ncbi:MAG: acyl-CoA dehydrogenase [Leucobacter sp.]